MFRTLWLLIVELDKLADPDWGISFWARTGTEKIPRRNREEKNLAFIGLPP